MLDERTHIVRVGAAGGDVAAEGYAEFAGFDLFGPFTREQAHALVTEILKVWTAVAAEDPEAFVYGVPEAEAVELRSPIPGFYPTVAQRLARNWYRDSEGRLEDVASGTV